MTPMFKQYLEIKENHPEAILFYRLGDFYEMFFEDAVIASRELGIALTSRDKGAKSEDKIPMCGIPFHSASNYISRLIKKGYHVAICEQLENPKEVKGIVKRGVVRVITPGTVLDEDLLDASSNNYIMSISVGRQTYGMAVADVTTGEFITCALPVADERQLIDQIAKFSPVEIIYREGLVLKETIAEIFGIMPKVFLPRAFEVAQAYQAMLDHFDVKDLSSFGIEGDKPCISASGALIEYLNHTQMGFIGKLSPLQKHQQTHHMSLDLSSRNNLELTKTIRTGEKKGSLLWVLDRTKTSMGARLLKKWLEEPLITKKAIKERLDAVEDLKENQILREDLQSSLKQIKDIERIIRRIASKNINVLDILALKSSLEHIGQLKKELKDVSATLLIEASQIIDPLISLVSLIETHIETDPDQKTLIKSGVDVALDGYKEAKTKGINWLLELEERERQATGIKTLKIKHAKTFGYCIEITHAHKALVPDHYVRRQTLVASERYITDELKEIEERILNAEDKVTDIEMQIFRGVVDQILGSHEQVAQTGRSIALIDVFASLAEVADKNNYTKPQITTSGGIDIKEGRHPVAEFLVKQSFVPNDVYLDTNEHQISVITGPNMAGKSTYMRGVALIALMAQVGSFVPCESAILGVVDRIFTRVGASDDLATGQSTFMVEMNEVANILNHATQNSLIILDEIGRGTSTYDGLCIAHAVLEHIATMKAKTLFATHYHELSQIEEKISGIKNYRVTVQEIDDELVFLRKIERGSIDKSYGIQVAKLSGIPETVINRAKALMEKYV